VDENFFQGMESSLQTLEISDSWLTYVPRGINKIGKRDVHCTGVYIVIKHEKKVCLLFDASEKYKQ